MTGAWRRMLRRIGPQATPSATRGTPRRLAAVAGAALLFLAGAGTSWAQMATKGSARDRLVVGLKAFQDGFHDLAAKELRAYLGAVPDDLRRADLLYVLAQADFAREDWAGARQALGELTAAGGHRAREAGYWLGWLSSREGDAIQALEHLDGYLLASGGEHRGDALQLAGDLALRLGRTAEAADRFSQFLEVAPSDPRRPAAWLGLVQARVGADPGGARDEARRALADPILKADPAAVEAAALSGVDAARRAKDPAAEATFWAVLADAARDEALRERARYEEGAALARSGDASGARETLRELILSASAGAHAAAAHLLLADLARLGGVDARGEVLGHLESALAFPDDPTVKPKILELRRTALELALAQGDLERAAGHARALQGGEPALEPELRALLRLTLAAAASTVDEALVHWDEVPADAARFREARLLAARALLAANRPRDALTRLEPLLGAEDPASEAHLTALAAAEAAKDPLLEAQLSRRLAQNPPPGASPSEFLHRRALALRAGGEDAGYGLALEELAAQPSSDPRAAWAATELAARAFDRGEWEAVLRWEAAARSGPQPQMGTFREAESLLRLGRVEEARAAFQALASHSGPDGAPALARLGNLRDQEGDQRGAAAAYRAALESGLGGDAAAWVRRRLAVLEGDGAGDLQ